MNHPTNTERYRSLRRECQFIIEYAIVFFISPSKNKRDFPLVIGPFNNAMFEEIIRAALEPLL